MEPDLKLSAEEEKVFWEELKTEIREGVLRIFISKGSELSENESRLQELLGEDFLRKICGVDLERLKRIHFCIHRAHVRDFNQELEVYFRSINHRTSGISYARKGMVKGRIDWKKTFEERFSHGQDRSLFSCKEIEKDYDLPENIILKFLLLKISEFISEFDYLIREDGKIDEGWRQDLLDLKYTISKIEKTVYFKEICKNITMMQLEQMITPRMESLANKSRNDFIRSRLMEEAYTEYKALMIYKDWMKINDVINETLLKPKNRSRLYEMFALNRLLLDFNENIRPGGMRPIDSSGGPVAAFEIVDSGMEVKIYDNTLPPDKTFRGEIYTKLKKKYFSVDDENSNDEMSRRPDIILEFKKPGNTKSEYIIIEVKLTTDKGYIKESLYKVMGYIYDFYLNREDIKSQQAILLVHSWGKDDVYDDLSDQIILLNYKNYKEKIKDIVVNLGKKRLNI